MSLRRDKIPKKYRRAFDRGGAARLSDRPREVVQVVYKAADYADFWRQGWDSAHRRLSAVTALETSSPDSPTPQEPRPVELRARRRDRRDRWRLNVEVLMAIGAVASSIFLWSQIQQQAGQINRQQEEALMIRRAQLLSTIYDRVCETSGEDTPAEKKEPKCWPRADTRARQEAALAFIEIERRRGELPDLRRANLNRADFMALRNGIDWHTAESFRDAVLSTDMASGPDLSGINLFHAEMNWIELYRANLNKAYLSRAILNNAGLFQATLYRTNLRYADLTEANLREADLREADLGGANLTKADLRKANLHGTILRATILLETDVRGVDLRQVVELTQKQVHSMKGDENTLLPKGLTRHAWMLREDVSEWNRWRAEHPQVAIDLRGADLSRFYLREANLRGSDLSESDLSGSNLEAAKLSGANLSGANLSGANLGAVIDLAQEQISGARCDDHTQLPEGLRCYRGM